MNVLIYTQSNYARNTFVNALFSAGITLYQTEHADTLINHIRQHQPEIVVLDVIKEDFIAVFELVKQIKNHASEEVKKTGIILLIGSIDKQTIESAIQVGVIGFIKSNATEDFVYKYIIDTYQKIRGVPPERKYARVKIDPNDRIGIKFRSPVNLQLIIGQIKDISFGGIAVELVGAFPSDSITIGSEIKNIQFILEGKDVFIDGEVVAYQKNFCAFRFKDMPAEIKETISQYVFRKISGLEEENKVVQGGTGGGEEQDKDQPESNEQ
jgi:CheY-like chemotaxis protein